MWGFEGITLTRSSVLFSPLFFLSNHNRHDPLTSLRIASKTARAVTHSFIDLGFARSIIFDAIRDPELNPMTRHTKFTPQQLRRFRWNVPLLLLLINGGNLCPPNSISKSASWKWLNSGLLCPGLAVGAAGTALNKRLWHLVATFDRKAAVLQKHNGVRIYGCAVRICGYHWGLKWFQLLLSLKYLILLQLRMVCYRVFVLSNLWQFSYFKSVNHFQYVECNTV